MLSRKEAIERVYKIAFKIQNPNVILEYNDSYETFFNEIYDSIGCCAKCKDGWQGESSKLWFCNLLDDITHEADFFCADFEPKEN